MKWLLKSVEKETNHRFLNFYVLHYEVDGKKRPYFLASRQENLRAVTGEYKRPDGVSILLYRDGPQEKEILFIEEFRPGVGRTCLDFPAGLLEENDANELEAAKREAKEEAGVEVADLQLLAPASPTSAGLSDELVSLVMGRVVGEGKQHLEEFEDIKARFVSLSEIKKILSSKDHFMPIHVRMAALYLLEKWK